MPNKKATSKKAASAAGMPMDEWLPGKFLPGMGARPASYRRSGLSDRNRGLRTKWRKGVAIEW